MRSIDDPLTASLANRMVSDDLAGVAHDDVAGENHNLHTLTDQAPRNRVTVGVEVDSAVWAHFANQVAQLPERRTAAKWAKGAGFVCEANERELARGAVDAHVSDLAVPLLEVRNERTPACEAAASHGIALYISHTALVLALGARPIRCASSR